MRNKVVARSVGSGKGGRQSGGWTLDVDGDASVDDASGRDLFGGRSEGGALTALEGDVDLDVPLSCCRVCSLKLEMAF
jgi:hypothetical protein